jgi:hemoglobin
VRPIAALLVGALLAGAVLAGAACRYAAPPGPPPAAPAAAPDGPSLYARLGGQDAIRAVVGDFLGRVAADPRINAFFRGVDADELAAKLTGQICEVTGGPCRYAGRSMREVHAGMHISDADFDALVEDLGAALDHLNVGAREKGELLNVLGGLRRHIVTRK